MYVLLRLDHGDVIKVRPAMAGCRLNAGGVPFEWLTGVQPDDSVAFLREVAARSVDGQNNQERQVGEGALVVLSAHSNGDRCAYLTRFDLHQATSA